MGLEEVAQFLFLVVISGWEPRDIGSFVTEPIGHEDLVLVFFVRVGEDIGALDGLGPVPKDVIDDQDTSVSAVGTGFV